MLSFLYLKKNKLVILAKQHFFFTLHLLYVIYYMRNTNKVKNNNKYATSKTKMDDRRKKNTTLTCKTADIKDYRLKRLFVYFFKKLFVWNHLLLLAKQERYLTSKISLLGIYSASRVRSLNLKEQSDLIFRINYMNYFISIQVWEISLKFKKKKKHICAVCFWLSR